MPTHEARNKQIVERYWDAHFRRQWDEMATFFTSASHYSYVGMDAASATGPEQIVAAMKFAIEALDGYRHLPKHIIAEGDLVLTERSEIWTFPTGETAECSLASVMELRDGAILSWRDYAQMPNIAEQAPQYWQQHLEQTAQADQQQQQQQADPN